MTETTLPSGATAVDAALIDCIEQAEGEGILLEDALARIGPASFCFVCLLLSVPFIQPISLGPLTMASGLTFMAAGWQMTRRHPSPKLPSAMQKMRLQGKSWILVLRLCQRVLRLCRKFTRPRFENWVTGGYGESIVGWLILSGGFLLFLPFANIPFNNTFPALMILFASIAWLERDGFMLFVSLAWGVISLIYFTVILVLLWFFGTQVFNWLHGVWQ